MLSHFLFTMDSNVEMLPEAREVLDAFLMATPEEILMMRLKHSVLLMDGHGLSKLGLISNVSMSRMRSSVTMQLAARKPIA